MQKFDLSISDTPFSLLKYTVTLNTTRKEIQHPLFSIHKNKAPLCLSIRELHLQPTGGGPTSFTRGAFKPKVTTAKPPKTHVVRRSNLYLPCLLVGKRKNHAHFRSIWFEDFATTVQISNSQFRSGAVNIRRPLGPTRQHNQDSSSAGLREENMCSSSSSSISSRSVCTERLAAADKAISLSLCVSIC